ncbi:hypothetical protein ACOMHN_022710 [Nucella lapillus]
MVPETASHRPELLPSTHSGDGARDCITQTRAAALHTQRGWCQRLHHTDQSCCPPHTARMVPETVSHRPELLPSTHSEDGARDCITQTRAPALHTQRGWCQRLHHTDQSCCPPHTARMVPETASHRPELLPSTHNGDGARDCITQTRAAALHTQRGWCQRLHHTDQSCCPPHTAGMVPETASHRPELLSSTHSEDGARDCITQTRAAALHTQRGWCQRLHHTDQSCCPPHTAGMVPETASHRPELLPSTHSGDGARDCITQTRAAALHTQRGWCQILHHTDQSCCPPHTAGMVPETASHRPELLPSTHSGDGARDCITQASGLHWIPQLLITPYYLHGAFPHSSAGDFKTNT